MNRKISEIDFEKSETISHVRLLPPEATIIYANPRVLNVFITNAYLISKQNIT